MTLLIFPSKNFKIFVIKIQFTVFINLNDDFLCKFTNVLFNAAEAYFVQLYK